MKDQAEFLRSLGLNAEAPGLVEVAAVAPDEPAKPKAGKYPADAHTMAVTSIVWDEAWLDGFDLDAQFADASRHLFAQFRSLGRDKDRNSLLHREIGQFITRLRRARKAGVPHEVTTKVKAGRPEREMAAVLTAAGVTEAELIEFLRARKEG